MRICSNRNDNELEGLRATVAKVPVDTSAAVTETLPLQAHGRISDFSIACQTFDIDYGNGEYVNKVEVYYDTFQIYELILTTN